MSLFLSPLAADLNVSVEELASDQPDLVGPDGAATQVFSLFNVALGTGTVAGPMLSGTLYHYAGWFVMCIALAVMCFSGSLPVVSVLVTQLLTQSAGLTTLLVVFHKR